MPEPRWPVRLERWLPEDAARDVFGAALADLQGDFARRRLRRLTPSRALLLRVWHAGAVAVLFVECLRVVVLDRAWPAGPRRIDPQRPRK